MKIVHLNSIYREHFDDYIFREDGTCWRYKTPIQKGKRVKILYFMKEYEFTSESIPNHIFFDGNWYKQIKDNINRAGGGYHFFTIKGRVISTHRTKALAWIPNPLNNPVVDHIDRNSRNNDLDNLRWCTISENARNVHSFYPQNLGEYLKPAVVFYLSDKNNKLIDSGTYKELIERIPEIGYRGYLHRNVGKFSKKLQCHVSITFND